MILNHKAIYTEYFDIQILIAYNYLQQTSLYLVFLNSVANGRTCCPSGKCHKNDLHTIKELQQKISAAMIRVSEGTQATIV